MMLSLRCFKVVIEASESKIVTHCDLVVFSLRARQSMDLSPFIHPYTRRDLLWVTESTQQASDPTWSIDLGARERRWEPRLGHVVCGTCGRGRRVRREGGERAAAAAFGVTPLWKLNFGDSWRFFVIVCGYSLIKYIIEDALEGGRTIQEHYNFKIKLNWTHD